MRQTLGHLRREPLARRGAILPRLQHLLDPWFASVCTYVCVPAAAMTMGAEGRERARHAKVPESAVYPTVAPHASPPLPHDRLQRSTNRERGQSDPDIDSRLRASLAHAHLADLDVEELAAATEDVQGLLRCPLARLGACPAVGARSINVPDPRRSVQEACKLWKTPGCAPETADRRHAMTTGPAMQVASAQQTDGHTR